MIILAHILINSFATQFDMTWWQTLIPFLNTHICNLI